MSREIHLARPVRSGGGAVLQGVVLSGEPRTLARPERVLPFVPATLLAAAAPAVQPIAVIGPALPTAAEVEALREEVRERAFRQGYEEGRSAGHAEGLAGGLARGREDGQREGLEQGRASGLREVEAAHAEQDRVLAERIARVQQLLDALPAQLARHAEQSAPDMLGLCFDAVAEVLGAAAATAEGTRAMVRQALAQAAASGGVTVRLHPRDLAALRGDAASVATGAQVTFVADERVQLGGCVIASAEGGLDARLETQLARLAALLAASAADAEAVA